MGQAPFRIVYTREDERLEPTAITHLEREYHLKPNLHEDMFQPLIFQGAS